VNAHPGASPDRIDQAPVQSTREWARLPWISPESFRRFAIAELVAVSFIVLTGAAVRLTGSGLGCPDWPTCYHRKITPQASIHPAIEFGNRMVTVALTIVVAAVLLAAWRRRPFRRDLCWLSASLVAGVVAQAVLGGIVVYTKLNPYLVMLHFLLSMVMVGLAVILLHRSRHRYDVAGLPLVPRSILIGSRAAVGLLALVLAAGTATTGAGPHAGNATGQQVAKRIPVPLRDLAELHATLAILLIGLVLGLVLALHALAVPERTKRAGRILCAVLAAQAVVGYAQYFSHLPAWLVEIHILGATSLVIGTLQFVLTLTHHPAESSPLALAAEHARGGSPEEALIGNDQREIAVGGW